MDVALVLMVYLTARLFVKSEILQRYKLAPVNFAYMQKGLVMKNKFPISNEKGFTLIEVISVMVILSIMASVGAKKVELLSTTADKQALIEGINQLNSRETLIWTDMKLSNSGWTNDANVFTKIIDVDFGPKYVWKNGPNAFGGTLHFKSKSITLNRSPSTAASWGNWH